MIRKVSPFSSYDEAKVTYFVDMQVYIEIWAKLNEVIDTSFYVKRESSKHNDT